ncbi:MAG: glycoside hydrolase family 3 N-terminal domain-containing protein [Asticcacaulis sp.]
MRLGSTVSALALMLAGCSSLPSLGLSGYGLSQPSDAPKVMPSQSVPAEARPNPVLWPASASPTAISSASTEAAITALMARMTVEQKVGQLIQADISAIKPEDLATYPIGSLLAGGNSGPYGDERASGAKWRQLVDEYRAASVASGAGVPILFGVDAVHGHSNLPGATIFPHNIGLGAARDPDLIRRIGDVTAKEIAASGIEWTFAPTLAVPQDYRWGRTYEGYAADPALIADYARAMTLGLQGTLEPGQPLQANKVAATAKHFLADGGTLDGRDQGDARISEAELIATHAQGYPAAIDAGALTVMASFSSWNGVKHHGNSGLLTGVLKERMGFEGLIVGDWNGHGQVPGCAATHCPQAINAGLDLFMAPDSWKLLYENTLKSVKAGEISSARLDDAVRRILRVKHKLGLMGDARIARGDETLIGADAHLDLAREAAAKSLVLLKNNDNALPIRPGARVLVSGSGADNMAMQAGGWTITWQGTDTKASDFPKGQTLGKAIQNAVTAAGGQAVVAPDGTSVVKPDVAVVVLGEPPYAEFEGDVPHLAYAVKPEEEALIARLKGQGVKVVVVFLSGRPMFTGGLINQADAFVAAWLPGTQGQGVADVLVAAKDGMPVRDFTGRLPFAWPADARSPVKNPLFATGYGLSYAQPARVGPVNADPGVDVSATGKSAVYILRGKVPAPWHMGLDGAVANRPIDLGAQEDARQFTWLADGAVSIHGPAISPASAIDPSGSLLIDWRIDAAPTGPLKLSLGAGALDLVPLTRTYKPGTAVQTRVPLSCFTAAGTKLETGVVPLKLETRKGFSATIRTVRLAQEAGTLLCPPAVR